MSKFVPPSLTVLSMLKSQHPIKAYTLSMKSKAYIFQRSSSWDYNVVLDQKKLLFFCRGAAFQNNTKKTHNNIRFRKEVKIIIVVDKCLDSLTLIFDYFLWGEGAIGNNWARKVLKAVLESSQKIMGGVILTQNVKKCHLLD